MENISKDLINVIQYLLPGFISAWIFYSFTSYSKPSQFERIIEALIFTFLIQTIVVIIKPFLYCINNHINILSLDDIIIILTSLTAIVIGFLFSFFANNDKFHCVIRFLRISKESSYPSEWFGAFNKTICYIVLHLKDERRLMGWPIEWPSDPIAGHFKLTDASWLQGKKQTVLTEIEFILINVEDVKWVEFIRNIGEK